MLFFHNKAQSAEFIISEFTPVIKSAKKGDVIYCDPPYVALSASANFTTYSSAGFSMDDQQQLALLAGEISNKGIPVLISNHNTSFTRKAYKQAGKIDKFYVQRYISCNGKKRESAGELLALFN